MALIGIKDQYLEIFFHNKWMPVATLFNNPLLFSINPERALIRQ